MNREQSNNLSDNVNTIMSVIRQSAEINRQTSLTVSDMSQILRNVHIKINALDDDMTVIKDRVDYLEHRVHLDPYQVMAIRKSVNQKIYSILGENKDMHVRYAPLLRKRLHKFLRDYHGMTYPIAMTPTGRLNEILDAIPAWNPQGGLAAIMKEADQNAMARKRARADGYV